MVSPEDLTGSKRRSLYAKRKPVYPKAVTGPFRRLKWAVMLVTLTIYYVTPWLRWDRGPWAPDQAVLVDLAHRRFYMFTIEIWPHEFYYVAGLLVMAGIGLFLVTSVVGRAWCGYACPQTVWTDLYQHVERWIDGDHNAQIRLANAPLNVSKVTRRVGKYAVWLAIAVLTGGAWIFYFADAPTLARAFIQGHAPFVAYATVGVLTATTFILGGFMREQVCIYMCPWPRIQTAMLDERSLLVTYKNWRGEPRHRGLKNATLDDLALGDCIDCQQCVQVCPTGIDIREGPQIGCITCALCIDACDKVMMQIGRPRGLIDYTTFEGAECEKAGQPAPSLKRTFLRPRTLLYFSLWGAVGLAMLFALGERTRLDISIQQDRNPVYVQLSDGHVRNAYTAKLRNMEARPRAFRLTLEGVPEGVMWNERGSRETARREIRVDVPADSVAKTHVFITAPRTGDQRSTFQLVARPLDGKGKDSATSAFERPEIQ